MRIILCTLILIFPSLAVCEGIHSFETLTYQQAVEKEFHITAECRYQELCDVTVQVPKFYNKYPYGAALIISRDFEISLEASPYEHRKGYVTGFFKIQKSKLRTLKIEFDYSVPADQIHWSLNKIMVSLKGIKRRK